MSSVGEVVGAGGRRQAARNLIANVGVFGTQTLVAVLFTPYLIDRLGVAVFGLIPLANTLASYASVITLSLQGSVGRFLAIAVRRDDPRASEEVFNTALWLTVAIAIVLLPVFTLLAYVAPAIFNIPPEATGVARAFFAVSFTAYLFDVVRGVFMTAGVSANRLDLQNIAPLIEVLLRPAITVVAFSLGFVSLLVVATGWLVGALAALGIAVIVWRRLVPDMRLSIAAFSANRLGRIWGTGAWMMVSQVGTLLFLAVDLVIANLVLGAEIAGAYGAVLVWAVFLRGAATAASGVVTPVALAAHAAGDEVRLTELMRSAVRLMGIAVGLPVFLVGGFASNIMVHWLGPGYERMGPVVAVLVFHLSVNLSVLPLFGLQLTKNAVRVPGLVTLGAGLVNVALAVALAERFPNGAGIALAGALVLTAKNAFFTPIYAARTQGINWTTYLRELPVPILMVLGFGFCAFLASGSGLTSSLVGLILTASALALVYALVAWRLLGAREQGFLMTLIPGFFRVGPK